MVPFVLEKTKFDLNQSILSSSDFISFHGVNEEIITWFSFKPLL